MEQIIERFCDHHKIRELLDEQLRAYRDPKSIVIILDFGYAPQHITQLYGHDVFYANIHTPVLIGTRIIRDICRLQTQWGHCPFCFTNQDMLENQSCCTICGEPLEEGKVEG
jgi:hypothetical protein